MYRRLSSTAAPAVGCFSAVRLSQSRHGMPGLVATRAVAAGEVLFRWTGVLTAPPSLPLTIAATDLAADSAAAAATATALATIALPPPPPLLPPPPSPPPPSPTPPPSPPPGVLTVNNTGDRCLQVGQRSWLTPGPEEEGEPAWVFLNHSFEPSVRVSHAPLPNRDPAPPVLTATAAAALPAEAPLTLDYTLHEYIMAGRGFLCAESGRPVRGFHFLDEAAQEAALPRAMHHVRTLHGQYLFGQSSRC